VNPSTVSNHVAGAGHAVRRAEAEVEAARKAAKGTKGAVSPFPAGHAEQQLAEAEDRLRGRVGERNVVLRSVIDRVARGDPLLTSPMALSVDQRIAAERRSDDADAYAASLDGGRPDPVVRELRENRRELQLLRDRLAPAD